MVNKGSPVSALNIVNINELIWRIREGEIKVYVYDEESGQWVRMPSRAKVAKPPSQLYTNRKTIPRSPTPLGSGEVVSVIIKAENTNSGAIYFGSSGVSDATGYSLQPGEVIAVDIDNLNKIYLFAEVSGDAVRYSYTAP